MTTVPQEITLRRPDDWHSHLRDDVMMQTVLPYTSRIYGRAIVMPNLPTPVTSISAAYAYRQRILSATPAGHAFTPLMTCYLTDSSTPEEIEQGYTEGIFTAAKLYPAHATTHSSHGVTRIDSLAPVLDRMQATGMPLLIHGEVTDSRIDIFDREAHFIDTVMEPLRRQYPALKVVFEHITTKEAADYVAEGNDNIAATITPQHLMFNRNHMLAGGLRPHLYCLPVLKRNIHQEALRQVIARGHPRFFLGSDTAPHVRHRKEASCGCAGVFSAPTALSAYATVFEELGALAHLEAFCSENGPRFYGLPLNESTITLIYRPWRVPESIPVGDDLLIPFLAGETVNWSADVI
ncbi:dihydroorotase [Enterobacteriaceae bacterium LUAb1]